MEQLIDQGFLLAQLIGVVFLNLFIFAICLGVVCMILAGVFRLFKPRHVGIDHPEFWVEAGKACRQRAKSLRGDID